MRTSLENKTFTIFLEGELNSYNAANIEKEIEGLLSKNEFDNLVLDFAGIRYVSSAGLRVILKLKQKYKNVSVVETSLEVYDVFQMTGFTNIMDIKKGLRRVYINGAEVIGDGFFSTVYRLDKDTIIKVFNKAKDVEGIESELKLAKEAFVLGIPTAISFDIVRVDDNYGVRFEMLDCMSLQNMIIKYPERMNELLDKYASLLKKMNTTECFNPEIPNIKGSFLGKAERIKGLIPDGRYEQIVKMVNALPDRKTLIHGDCHIKNIMVQKDDLILIDMDSLSVGYPIFELEALYFAYVVFNEGEGDNAMEFFHIKKEDAIAMYNGLMKRYFGKEDQKILDKIRLLSYVHVLFWNRKYEKDNTARFEFYKEKLLKLLDKYQDLDIGI